MFEGVVYCSRSDWGCAEFRTLFEQRNARASDARRQWLGGHCRARSGLRCIFIVGRLVAYRVVLCCTIWVLFLDIHAVRKTWSLS